MPDSCEMKNMRNLMKKKPVLLYAVYYRGKGARNHINRIAELLVMD